MACCVPGRRPTSAASTERIAEQATYDEPHRLATGVHHVWVNGVAVIAGGEHTGATPRRFLRRGAATPTAPAAP